MRDTRKVYTIQLCHTTLKGLGSGISVRKEVTFDGTLNDAKKEASRILKEVNTRKPLMKWEQIGKTHIQLGCRDADGNGGYSVSVTEPEPEQITLF